MSPLMPIRWRRALLRASRCLLRSINAACIVADCRRRPRHFRKASLHCFCCFLFCGFTRRVSSSSSTCFYQLFGVFFSLKPRAWTSSSPRSAPTTASRVIVCQSRSRALIAFNYSNEIFTAHQGVVSSPLVRN